MIPRTNLNQSILTSYWSKYILIYVSPVTGLSDLFTTEDSAPIARSKAQAEQRKGTKAVGEEAGQPNDIIETLDDVQGYIPEMKSFFFEATMKAMIEASSLQSTAGPSGLRYSHL